MLGPAAFFITCVKPPLQMPFLFATMSSSDTFWRTIGAGSTSVATAAPDPSVPMATSASVAVARKRRRRGAPDVGLVMRSVSQYVTESG